MKLIEATMKEVNEDFPGIEIEGYPAKKGFFRMFGMRKKTRITVVGPAKILTTVKKEKDLIKLSATTEAHTLSSPDKKT
jgi:hypothetical protein